MRALTLCFTGLACARCGVMRSRIVPVLLCAFLLGPSIASGSVTAGPWVQQQEFTSRDAPSAGDNFGLVIAEDAAGDTALVADPYKTTFVVIRAPQPGPWTITPSPGSAPLRRIRSAVSLPDPSVRAKVGGSGWARTLTYRVRQIAGQTVTFIEAGRKTVGAIGTARDARGRVRFTPAAGPAGVRSVVAIVSENGIPRARIVVAHYRAPGPRRPARPSHLTVRRRGTTLLVNWRRVTAATRYSVYVRISDGRRLLRLVTTSRLRIPEVGTTRSANVTVTAFDNARPGAAATKTIRPVAKRPKRPGRKHPKR